MPIDWGRNAKQHDAPSCGQYPNSIVCSYHQKTEVANDIEALIDVLSEFEKSPVLEKYHSTQLWYMSA